MTIWQEFDRLLPLAKAGAEKPLFPLRTCYITALEKVLDSCAAWFVKVNGMIFTCISVLTRVLLRSGFPRLLENPGKSWIFFFKFPGPGKSWKITLVLESPGN